MLEATSSSTRRPATAAVPVPEVQLLLQGKSHNNIS
jgi:hypothetical protein